MNKNSNTYIFMYASIMVVVVAAILSFAAMSLKPMQDKNEEVAKKYDILRSVNKAAEADQVEDKDVYVENEFKEFITESFVVDAEGNIVEGLEAFDLNLKVEYSKDLEERSLPIYLSKADDGSILYIIPLRGKGLWGPIWGYVSLREDMNTIFGAIFDHKGETPGLGAEISTEEFQLQFKSKSFFDASTYAFEVLKGDADTEGNHFAVNGITGGTITSNGLEDMLNECLRGYQGFFKKQKE